MKKKFTILLAASAIVAATIPASAMPFNPQPDPPYAPTIVGDDVQKPAAINRDIVRFQDSDEYPEILSIGDAEN